MSGAKKQHIIEITEEADVWFAEVKVIESAMLEHLKKAPADACPRWLAMAKTDIQNCRIHAYRAVTEK
jgi:hypothetical protein